GSRPFARGYAIAALAYLPVVMGHWENNPFAAIASTIDSYLVAPLHRELMPILVTRYVEPGVTMKETMPEYYEIQKDGVTRAAYGKNDDRHNTLKTMQLILTVLLGCVGGCVAVMLRPKLRETTGITVALRP